MTAAVALTAIRKLIIGQDYRAEVVALIDAEFMEYAIDFFKRVAEAKMRSQPITTDWYKHAMLSDRLPKEEIAIHAGLNIKTVSNMYNTARKEVVIDASREHYDTLFQAIQELTSESDLNLTLTIKLGGVGIDLDINESLIVMNTLAVARAALRGGIWSTAGKQVEKPLVMTLCALHRVPLRHYDQNRLPPHKREVDFYLLDGFGKLKRCEVKLMGKGNPESADAAFARDAQVLIADKLSEKNKQQLTEAGILWMELRGASDLTQFEQILTRLQIPFTPLTGSVERKLDQVLRHLFEESDFPERNPFAVREVPEGYLDGYLVDFTDES